MNKQYKKFKDLHDIFWGCCLFFAILFFFNHNFSRSSTKAKPEKYHEYVIAHTSPVISENHELKIYKSPYRLLTVQELTAKHSLIEREQEQKIIPAKDFSQIKILLKLNRFHLYFASGFHEPPLAA